LKLDRQAELILAISPVRVRGQRGARPWWSRGSGLWLASPDSSARPEWGRHLRSGPSSSSALTDWPGWACVI